MTAFLLNHIHNCRQFARNPQKSMVILKFIEQDKGFVPWVTMLFIPKEKRWSSLNKVERLSSDFVTEEQCQKEAGTGIYMVFRRANSPAVFDPQITYEVSGDIPLSD
jgi:hypothetical protein